MPETIQDVKDFIRRQTVDPKNDAIAFINQLNRAKTFFCALSGGDNPSFDFKPFYAFTDVQLFIYAGCAGTQREFWNAFKAHNEPLLTATQFGRPYQPLKLKREETPQTPMDKLFPPNSELPFPKWAMLIKLSRRGDNQEGAFWLLCVSGDPLLELRRFCNPPRTLPKYLALSGPNGRVLQCSDPTIAAEPGGR